MRIAIDCRLFSSYADAVVYQAFHWVHSIVSKTSTDEFFLVFDQQPSPDISFPPHCRPLILKPAAKTGVLRGLWYDLRLPALLAKHQIDLFVGACGYISLRSSVRQAIVLHDMLSGEDFPAAAGWKSGLYRSRLKTMLEKAEIRLAASEAQASFTGGSSFPVDAIPFFHPPVNSADLTDHSRRVLKEKFTGGTEFFYCEEGWNNLTEAVDLLLAFSAFKKRMQTGMKLVLGGKGTRGNEWKQKLDAYRFKDDVVVLPESMAKEERVKILTAAYGLIHLSAGAKTFWLQAAMHYGVPVVVNPHPVLADLGKDALLPCTDNPGESLAQNMMRLYKDENMRSVAIARGLTLAQSWDPEKAAEAFYKKALTCKD
ncbi:MAG: hypothetical protein MUE99_05300 [Chitinophagaceae bacterium]|nr:hypothetical protein [Chitinophagaceae bacterium]